MEKLLIVSRNLNECFTLSNEEDAAKDIERAKQHYSEDLALVTENRKNYPNMDSHWQSQIERYSAILDGGFEAITFEEYDKRQRAKYLNKEPKEVTAKDFDDMLNVLPPLAWVRTDNYSMFCVGECYTMTYYAQYLYNKENGKYYTALVDIYDKTTWLDKRLGLVAA